MNNRNQHGSNYRGGYTPTYRLPQQHPAQQNYQYQLPNVPYQGARMVLQPTRPLYFVNNFAYNNPARSRHPQPLQPLMNQFTQHVQQQVHNIVRATQPSIVSPQAQQNQQNISIQKQESNEEAQNRRKKKGKKR